MALTVGAFLTRFPEFTKAPTATIEACIAEAEQEIEVGICSAVRRDNLVKYLTAHLIASNPKGEFAKLDKTTGDTMYSARYKELKSGIPAGFRAL